MTFQYRRHNLIGISPSIERFAMTRTWSSLYISFLFMTIIIMTIALAATTSSSTLFCTAFQHTTTSHRPTTTANNSRRTMIRSSSSPSPPAFRPSHRLYSTPPLQPQSSSSSSSSSSSNPTIVSKEQQQQQQQLVSKLQFVQSFFKQDLLMNDNNNKNDDNNRNFKDWIPPPPEDQFIMTGDICVLFFYAFTSHSLNDYIVQSVLSDAATSHSHQSIQQAVRSLDPTGELISVQSIPVWVEPKDTLMVDHALSVHAQESLLNHWGPLFSTEGSACVTLCMCWLLAGWIHRAFHFSNSVDCTTDRALSKVAETWLSMAIMLIVLSVGTSYVVDHFIIGPQNDLPTLFLQQQRNLLQCGDVVCSTSATATASTVPSSSSTAHDASTIMTNVMTTMTIMTPTVSVPKTMDGMNLLTKADGMFIVDSMSVLVAWRFMANRILNMWT